MITSFKIWSIGLIFTLIWWVIFTIGTLFLPTRKARETFAGWCMHKWSVWVLALSGVTINCTGREFIVNDHPTIFIANHQSTYDIFVLCLILPRGFKWVAKQELFRLPVIGWFMHAAGFVPLNRARILDSLNKMSSAEELIKSGRSLVIFPEGTRSHDNTILPFKSGAFALAINTGFPLIPIGLSGSGVVLPKNSFHIRPGIINVSIGREISPAGFTLDQRKELAGMARRELIRLTEGHL